MAELECVREVLTGPLTAEYVQEKEAAGWRLAVVEWVREKAGSAEMGAAAEEVPYGMRVARDCVHLEEDPTERAALLLMMELIIQETRMPQVAAELNHRGFRTRGGLPWSPVAVFNMLPRLIEVGPRVFTSEEWVARRARLPHAV